MQPLREIPAERIIGALVKILEAKHEVKIKYTVKEARPNKEAGQAAGAAH